MVFMNMGGPSTTDEVHGFLSMLFVGVVLAHCMEAVDLTGIGGQRSHPSRAFSELHWTVHCAEENTQDSKTVCRNWRRFAYQEVVRIPGRRNVQDPGQDITRNRTA
jgi:protoheme ferro-lyase